MIEWLDKIISFLNFVFKNNSFKKKYRTMKVNKLKKIWKSNKWQIVDLRNSASYDEHHINGSVNVPVSTFSFNYFNKIDKSKKILILNSNYRSDLNIYRNLKRKNIRSYILYANYNDIRNNPNFEEITTFKYYE